MFFSLVNNWPCHVEGVSPRNWTLITGEVSGDPGIQTPGRRPLHRVLLRLLRIKGTMGRVSGGTRRRSARQNASLRRFVQLLCAGVKFIIRGIWVNNLTRRPLQRIISTGISTWLCNLLIDRRCGSFLRFNDLQEWTVWPLVLRVSIVLESWLFAPDLYPIILIRIGWVVCGCWVTVELVTVLLTLWRSVRTPKGTRHAYRGNIEFTTSGFTQRFICIQTILLKTLTLARMTTMLWWWMNIQFIILVEWTTSQRSI